MNPRCCDTKIKGQFLVLCLSSMMVLCSSSLLGQTTDPLCGPRCVQAVLQRLGVKTSIEEIVRLSGYDEKDGTTILGLCRAARKKGLYAEGVKMGLDGIIHMRSPAIAYLWNNHFVLVEGTGTDTLVVTDPPIDPQYVPRDRFQSYYSGFALLISEVKISLPKAEMGGADLRLEEYVLDLGKMGVGETREKKLSLRNLGDQNLVISSLRSTCGCAAVLLSSRSIPPQGRGEIKVAFDSAGRSGFQVHRVYIHSNDRITPIVQLQIQVLVRADLGIWPKTLVLGNIKKGTSACAPVLLIDRTGENTRITGVDCSTPLLATSSTSVVGRNYRGYRILVSIGSDAPLGQLEARLVIRTTDKKHPVIEIPVSANIVGDIEVSPSEFFFGFVKEGEIRASLVTVSANSAIPFGIEKVEVDIPFRSTAFQPIRDGRQYALQTTLHKNAPPGHIKGTVTIHTDNPDQPRMEIPVHGIVERLGQ